MVITAPVWGLLELGFLFSFAFLWAFDPFWRHTLGAAFQRLADIGFGGVRGVGAVHPLRFLRTVDEAVLRWIANGKAASERGVVYAFNKLVDSVALLFGVPLAIALGLYELTQYVVHHVGKTITRVEHTKTVEKQTTTIKAQGAVTKVQFNHLAAREAALERRVNHMEHAHAGTIAIPFPRIGRVERDLSGVKSRLKKIEKAIAVGASAALVWTALRRLGLKWLRCGNVNKAGRAVCGMNPNVLESLLFDAALLTVSFNLVTFAEEMQSVTGEAARLIHNFAD